MKEPKVQNRPKLSVVVFRLIIILVLVNPILASLYSLLGHKLVQLIYQGSLFPFLNNIISGQSRYPLEYYINLSDIWAVKIQFFINILIILISFSFGRFFLFILISSIILSELILRIIEPYCPSAFSNVENLGIKQKPFFGSANSLGFNDKEYPKKKPAGVIRIVGLGDSFNWAGGYENNYWTKTEMDLQKSLGKNKVEILNQGTSQIGPAYLLKLLKQESINFDPDVVILSIFVGNDFIESDSAIFRKVRFGYPLDIYLTKVNDIFDPIRNSYLWFFCSNNMLCLKDTWLKKQEGKSGLKIGSISRSKFLEIERRRLDVCTELFYESNWWRTTKKRLLEFKDFLSKKNILFLVVILPDEYQVEDSLQNEIFVRFQDIKKNQYNFDLPQKMLETYLKSININFLDLLPVFIDKTESGEELYTLSDTHFNNAGNELAAKLVSQFLIARLRLKNTDANS